MAEVGKQCKYMEFFFAQEAYMFPSLLYQGLTSLLYQGLSVVYIKYNINKICARLIPFTGETCNSPYNPMVKTEFFGAKLLLYAWVAYDI